VRPLSQDFRAQTSMPDASNSGIRGPVTPDPRRDDCTSRCGLRTLTLLRRAMFSGVPETSLRRRLSGHRFGYLVRSHFSGRAGPGIRIDDPGSACL